MKKGTFTIQFAIIFPVILMVVLTSIDISSIAYHYNRANRAVNMASFSALSNFNYDLKERYGVFGVDTKSLNENVKFYVQENYCDNKDDEDKDKVKVKVSASANNDKITVIRQLDNQIMAFTKYRVPLTAIKLFLSKLDFLKKSEDINDAADEVVDLFSDRGEDSLNQYYKNVDKLKMNINDDKSQEGKQYRKNYRAVAKFLKPNEKVVVEDAKASLEDYASTLNKKHEESFKTVKAISDKINNLPDDASKKAKDADKVYGFIKGKTFNEKWFKDDALKSKCKEFDKNITHLDELYKDTKELHGDISVNREAVIKKYEDQIHKIKANPNIKAKGKKDLIDPLEEIVNKLKKEKKNNDGEKGRVSTYLKNINDVYLVNHEVQYHVLGIKKLDELSGKISSAQSYYQSEIDEDKKKKKEYEEKKKNAKNEKEKLEENKKKNEEKIKELKEEIDGWKKKIEAKEKRIEDYNNKIDKLKSGESKVNNYRKFVNSSSCSSPNVNKHDEDKVSGDGEATYVNITNFKSENFKNNKGVTEGNLKIGKLKSGAVFSFKSLTQTIDGITKWLDVKARINDILGKYYYVAPAEKLTFKYKDVQPEPLVKIDLSNLTGGENLFSLDGISGLMNNIYLNEYIIMTFRSVVTGKGKFTGDNPRNKNLRFVSKSSGSSNFSAQVEYVVCGNSRDLSNVGNCCLKILLIRMIPNCAYVVMKFSSEIWSIASLTGWLAPVTYVILLGIWAGAESLYDLIQLLQGEGSAFLNLRPGDFALDGFVAIKELLLDQIAVGVNKFVLKSVEGVGQEILDDTVGNYYDDVDFEIPGKIKANNYTDFKEDPSLMTYEDYLRIFLLMTDRDSKLKRIANLYALDGYDIVNDYSNNVTVKADFELDLVFIPRVLVMMQKMTGVDSQNIDEKYTIHIKREMAY